MVVGSLKFEKFEVCSLKYVIVCHGSWFFYIVFVLFSFVLAPSSWFLVLGSWFLALGSLI